MILTLITLIYSLLEAGDHPKGNNKIISKIIRDRPRFIKMQSSSTYP